jgi:arginyl-tRNA synthetase
MNILQTIEASFFSFLTSTFNLQPETIRSIELTLNVDPAKQQFGDLSSNAALVLAKSLQQPPRAIAEKICAAFTHAALEKIEIAGPGFMNMYLTDASFKLIAQELFTDKAACFKKSPEEKACSYSIEFVSANPTGPLHIGHGRGGIIGDVLARILRFRGEQVTTEFYINDAGAQIKKLGLSFKARCFQGLGHTGHEAQVPEDGYQGEYLAELATQCIQEKGSSLLQEPESFFEAYAKEHLLQKIKETLQAYGISFDVWFSEKILHDTGVIQQALDFLKQRGFIEEKDGALWFLSTKFGDDKDRVVKRNNGELTYVAADIAYLQNKIARGFDKIIMVLGQDHHSYVVRLKAVMQALGHNPDDLDIILYQLVTLKESGELLRMSKRAGRIVTLEDVIDTVGSDVARFFYLNRKADAHLDFDIDLALKKTEENPVYYLQYAYVRTASILEKALTNPEFADINALDAVHLTKEERILLKKILALNDVLKTISRTYHTHMLAYYVIELAHAFHSYYAANRVLSVENPETTRARLLLVTIVRDTLGTCLELLGVSRPQRM